MELHSILIIHPSSISTKQQTEWMTYFKREREKNMVRLILEHSIRSSKSYSTALDRWNKQHFPEHKSFWPFESQMHEKWNFWPHFLMCIFFHIWTLQWIIAIQSKLTDTMHSRRNNRSKEQQILIYWTFQLKCSLFSLVNFQND